MAQLRAITILVMCILRFAYGRVCEPIRIETCRDLGYNVTGMPNLVGHELQQDAQLQLQTFTPLIQYGCSSRLRFFLCSVYVPMCTEKVPTPIGPCRSLCEDARDRCQPILQEFGFPWPSGLNCSKFPPQNNNQHMCMEGPTDSKGSESKFRNRNRRPSIINNRELMIERKKFPITKIYSQHYGLCKYFRYNEHYYFINRTQRCAVLCSVDINFSHDNKKFADFWLAIWVALCFVTTLFTLLTSCIEDAPFRYPEGAIVFISACYNVCSIAYIIRLIVGRIESSCHLDSQHDAFILIQEGLDNMYCTLIFVMLYFFNMAAAGWWVILCITWCLSIRLRWTPEAIDRYTTYFHFATWTIPSIMTLIILVMRIIDADELVGTCYVGNQSTSNLLTFVILPSSIYLCIGIVFLIMGQFPKVCCRRYYSQVQTNSVPRSPLKLNSLMVRIGIFAALYVVPALCVLASNIYEYLNRENWIKAGSNAQPNAEIFTLKIFMSLIMGFTTSLWMWSSKAPLQTWKNLGKRLFTPKEPLPPYLNVRPQPLTISDKNKRLRLASSETIL